MIFLICFSFGYFQRCGLTPSQPNMAKNITFKDDGITHLENCENEKGFATPDSSFKNEAPFSIEPKVSARLRHAVDWRLIPALGAMYGISLMDRKNVSNAAIAGMLVDLKMGRGMGYNLVNLCFFITYVLCQPFMVILCRKVGPRYFLPGMLQKLSRNFV